MRGGVTLLIIAAAVALCAVVYLATGGRFFVFVLPLLFGLPFLWRRRS